MLKSLIKSCISITDSALWEQGGNKRSSSRMMLLLGGFFMFLFMSIWFVILMGIGLSQFGVFPASWVWAEFSGAMQWGLAACFSTMLPYLSNLAKRVFDDES